MTLAPSRPHLGRVAGREVLDMDGRGDDSAGDAQALGDVALHLRSQHQLGLRGDDGVLDDEMIVGDQRLDALFQGPRRAAHGQIRGCRCQARRTSKASSSRAMRAAGDGVGGIAEDEDALARSGRVESMDREYQGRRSSGGCFTLVSMPAISATALMNRSVAPTPIGGTARKGWPCDRFSQSAATWAISG